MDFSDVDQGIPRRLPLLDEWIDTTIDAQPLAGVTVLQIQHQLGNHYPQVAALRELGVLPEDMYWVDIPYTSHEVVRNEITDRLAVPEHAFDTHSFDPLDHYPTYQLRRVQKVVSELLSNPPERLVVLDDGAYFLEAASCFAQRLPKVAIVEQTTRGFIKLRENAAMADYADSLPLVNVAGSTPKRTLEPPFIAGAVCESLARHIRPYLDLRSGMRCLVLGYGAIGAKVAEFVAERFALRKCDISISDPVAARETAASDAGFAVWDRKDRSKRFNAVIGCSGRQSFQLGDRIFLEDGAVLASASSGAVELSRRAFIELANASDTDDISIVDRDNAAFHVHSDLQFELVDRTATFVNGGFPVNFDGRVNALPHEFIQATPTMMVSAAVQAAAGLNNDNRGLVDLDSGFSSWLSNRFRANLDTHYHCYLDNEAGSL